MSLYISYYKTKLDSVSLSCKSHRSKTANIKFYSQIQRIDASDHIYVNHRPVVNVTPRANPTSFNR